MAYDWVFNEVNNLIKSPLKGFNFDEDYLHLRNPESEKIIDVIFFKKFFPKIEKAFQKSNFIIYKDKDYPHFINKISVRLVKHFSIFIDDPKRPIKPGLQNRIWVSRFNLELSKYDYMLSTELILYLPEDFEINKILQLLKNPYFEGLPPDLSIDGNSYAIKFHTGKGAGWGLESYDEAANLVVKKIIHNHKLLNFLNEHEYSLNNEDTFIKLENLLVNHFENW